MVLLDQSFEPKLLQFTKIPITTKLDNTQVFTNIFGFVRLLTLELRFEKPLNTPYYLVNRVKTSDQSQYIIIKDSY